MSDPVGPPSASASLAKAGGVPWRLLLRREWGLLVLALALSFMVFSLVRSDIDSEQVLSNIRVSAYTEQPGVVVRFEPRADQIQLTLNCSQMDFREAERAVSGPDATPARLLLGAVQAGGRPLGSQDRLELPFSSSYVKPGSLQQALDQLDGFAYITERRTVRYLSPPTIPTAEELLATYGVRCVLTYTESDLVDGVLLPRSMDVRRGAGSAEGGEREGIRPDPVDLRPYLTEATVENGFEVELARPVRFQEWRARSSNVPGEDLWRRTMELPERRVKAQFEVVNSWRTERLANAVVLLLRDAHLYELQIRERDRLGMSDLMDRVSGVIEAPREQHELLRTAGERNLLSDTLAGWVWGIQITSGELPTEVARSSEMQGRIVFLPIAAEFVSSQVKFIPDPLQREFTLTLERK